ncbi:MAG: hypothetical protein V7K36_07680, partial [Nostoc sp.]
MRLSPVLLAAVAIAVPLGGSMSANAEAAKGSKQTTEVLTLETNQQPEKDTGQRYTSESLKSRPNPTGITEAEHLQSGLVPVYTAKPAAIATSEVIVPTFTTPRTAQTPQINPNSTQQPSTAPVIPPPASQEQTPSPTPETTPVPENVNPPTTEPLLPTTPEPSTAPVIPPPASQEQTPSSTPETTPVPENVNPPTTEPLLPTTPEPSTAPV